MIFGKKTAAIRVGASSETGKVREENQDKMSRFFSPLGEVFIVADGMGGHKGGGLAAEMVTQGFEDRLIRMQPGTPIPAAMGEVANAINAEIHREANSGNLATEKMGSTVVMAILQDGRLTIGHVGDSRAYLLRQGRLTRLTRDHSRVQKMVDHGMLSEADAREHPDASVLNRSMGGKPSVEMEVAAAFSLQDGDAVILCTDGLSGYLTDDSIGKVIAAAPEAQAAADALVALALQAGGEDNVTIQVIQCGQRKPCVWQATSTGQAGAGVRWRPRALLLSMVAAFLFAVLGAGFFLGIQWPFGIASSQEKAAVNTGTISEKPAKPDKPGTLTPQPSIAVPTVPAAAGEGAPVEAHSIIIQVLGKLSDAELAELKKGSDGKPIHVLVVSGDRRPTLAKDEAVLWFRHPVTSPQALDLRKRLKFPDKAAKQMTEEIAKSYPTAAIVISAPPPPPDGPPATVKSGKSA